MKVKEIYKELQEIVEPIHSHSEQMFAIAHHIKINYVLGTKVNESKKGVISTANDKKSFNPNRPFPDTSEIPPSQSPNSIRIYEKYMKNKLETTSTEPNSDFTELCNNYTYFTNLITFEFLAGRIDNAMHLTITDYLSRIITECKTNKMAKGLFVAFLKKEMEDTALYILLCNCGNFINDIPKHKEAFKLLIELNNNK
jgi:hypothetical protein